LNSVHTTNISTLSARELEGLNPFTAVNIVPARLSSAG
jgi:hypothetical protein